MPEITTESLEALRRTLTRPRGYVKRAALVQVVEELLAERTGSNQLVLLFDLMHPEGLVLVRQGQTVTARRLLDRLVEIERVRRKAAKAAIDEPDHAVRAQEQLK